MIDFLQISIFLGAKLMRDLYGFQPLASWISLLDNVAYNSLQRVNQVEPVFFEQREVRFSFGSYVVDEFAPRPLNTEIDERALKNTALYSPDLSVVIIVRLRAFFPFSLLTDCYRLTGLLGHRSPESD